MGSIYQQFNLLLTAERMHVVERVFEDVAAPVPVMIEITGDCMADVILLDLGHREVDDRRFPHSQEEEGGWMVSGW